MEKKTAEKLGLAMIPVMSIYALGASQGGVNAGMATFGMAFPDAGANIGYVVSMVALGMIPSGIISGLVTGKFIKYRTSVIAAIVLYLISGLFPFFMPDGSSFATLLASRFVFGFAVGWCYPIGQALVFKACQDEHVRAKWLGWGMAFFNLGSMAMEFAGGYLALVAWQWVFLVYLIGIIPLIIVIVMLKEPKSDAEQAAERHAEEIAVGEKVKAKIPPIAFCYMFLLFAGCTLAMPTILYASFVLGDPATAGLVLTAMTLVGALTGFTLGPVYKKLGKWTVAFGMAWLGILFVVAAMVSQPGSFNMPIYLLGFLVGHWGFAIIIPGTADMVTNLTPIGAATRAMGWNTAWHQLGCFAATPVAAFILTAIGGMSPIDVILPSAIGVCIVAVLSIILAAFTKMEKYGENYGK